MTTVLTVFDRMTDAQKLTAVRIDITQSPLFANISGYLFMGEYRYEDGLPTACTNGSDLLFGREFMQKQTREESRWVVLHEGAHIGLCHCVNYVEYEELVKKYPKQCNQAMDYVVNGIIYEADPQCTFAKPPACIQPLFNIKYLGWSWLQVLKDILKNDKGGGKGGNGNGEPFDEHRRIDRSKVDRDKLEQNVSDAGHQGQMFKNKLTAGNSKGGDAMNPFIQDRDTNWAQHTQQFIEEVCEGDDHSTYSKPNKRMLAQGILLPTHFSLTPGFFIIAADTSGSTHHMMPIIMGEMVRICKNVNPDMVKVLYWGSSVVGVQDFTPDTFDKMKDMLKVADGGGTHEKCVADYIVANDLKPKGVIFISDGELDGSGVAGIDCPVLWGIIDNKQFASPKGKVVHINGVI